MAGWEELEDLLADIKTLNTNIEALAKKIVKGKPFKKTLTYSADVGASTQTITPTDLVSNASRIYIKKVSITTSTNTTVTALKVEGVSQEYTQAAALSGAKDFKTDDGENALMETSIEIDYNNSGAAAEDQTVVVEGLYE